MDWKYPFWFIWCMHAISYHVLNESRGIRKVFFFPRFPTLYLDIRDYGLKISTLICIERISCGMIVMLFSKVTSKLQFWELYYVSMKVFYFLFSWKSELMRFSLLLLWSLIGIFLDINHRMFNFSFSSIILRQKFLKINKNKIHITVPFPTIDTFTSI